MRQQKNKKYFLPNENEDAIISALIFDGKKLQNEQKDKCFNRLSFAGQIDLHK